MTLSELNQFMIYHAGDLCRLTFVSQTGKRHVQVDVIPQYIGALEQSEDEDWGLHVIFARSGLSDQLGIDRMVSIEPIGSFDIGNE